MISRLFVAAFALLSLLCTAGPAAANPVDLVDFNVTTSGGPPQAAAHQDFTTSFSFCDPNTANPCTPAQQAEDARNVVVSASGGLLGNPQAPRNTGGTNAHSMPFCENHDYVADNCPAYTIVGYSSTYVLIQGGVLDGFVIPLLNQPVYNVRPQGAELGRLGAIATLDLVNKNYLPTLVTVRTSDDYGLDNVVLDLPQTGITGFDPGPVPIKVRRIDFTLCGYVTGSASAPYCTSTPGPANPPFVNMPTNCDAHAVSIRANSYEDTTESTASVPFQAQDCASVPFAPTFGINNQTKAAGAPSAYDVDLNVPTAGVGNRRQAHVKKSTTVLPEGVRLNPAAAARIDACSASDFGYGNDNAVACPAESRIGDVRIESDSIDGDPQDDDLDPMTGAVYLAEPTPAKPWRIFAVAEGGGLRQKLIGDTTVDPTSGRLTTVFDNSPQLPFSKVRVSFRGGDDSILLNPPTCGSFSGSQTSEPWSGTTPVTDTASVQTDFDGAGAGCPAGVPFAPSITAQAGDSSAGADPQLRIEISSPDGHQAIKSANVSLPAGLVGRITGMPLCSAAAAASGACATDSRIATVTAAVGTSVASSVDFGGSMYLAEPLVADDPASVVIVIPARSGPIDLGDVVVRGRVKLRASDAGLDVTVNGIPAMFKGVPTPLRKAVIEVDRKGFMRNPTGCGARDLHASFTGRADYGSDGQASASTVYRASGCERLGFSPRISFSTGGRGNTGNESHPPLHTVISVPDGQSAIARAVVTLPDVFRPDTVNLNKTGALCQQAQLDAGGCPAASRVGSASATTPLLPAPLSGPVYVVQAPGQVLPKLVVQLGGMVSLRLEGQSSLSGVRTTTDFAANPDVPLTRFSLSLDGGSSGILKTRGSLCDGTPTADVAFTAHSGASSVQRPRLQVAGCAKLTISKRSLKVRRGIVKVPVRCDEGHCAGKLSLSGKTTKKARSSKKKKKHKRGKRKSKPVKLGSKSFSLNAGESKIVKIKLNRSARKLLRRSRKLRVTATAVIVGDEFAQSLKISSTKKKSKRKRS